MREDLLLERMAEAQQDNSGEQETVTREQILALMKQRDDVDEQIQALGGILTSNKVGMTEPLVDAEGFPRNDIDVYQVRHARHTIICLQNDFKALTKDIDKKLQIFHAQVKAEGREDVKMEVEEPAEELRPIAKVNLVSEGSPAYHAGLIIDDAIMQFGSINSQNFSSLTDIASLVQRSSGNVVTVKVKREGAVVRLALIPGPWAGRGLLGCNIVPFEAVDR